ncbi:MAG: hypothetical protein HW419_2141 [Deltaproteobacteria bacterium]|nr:hypothetical protein [Deltaproteobacteria bacterium]
MGFPKGGEHPLGSRSRVNTPAVKWLGLFVVLPHGCTLLRRTVRFCLREHLGDDIDGEGQDNRVVMFRRHLD